MNVAIYLRKSREDQEETREETLARHERMLFDYCKRNDLLIKEIYKEVVSGESIDNRPEMQRLLNDVAKCKYEGVVVIEIERLSRGNQIDQAEILEIFKKSKTKILTLNKVYDLSSDNDFDEDFFEFGLFMSRREYKIINRRLLRGRKQAQQEGYFIGTTTPFGYTKERQDKGFVLVADENAEIVKLIFNKFAYENWGLGDLRRYLTANNIKGHLNQQRWENKGIKRILQNKVYLGFININTKKSETSTVKGKHKPIIDEKTFNVVQELLKQRESRTAKGKELVNPLATILKCGVCGRTMARFTKCDEKRTQVYRCPLYCGNISSNSDLVEHKLINELKEELNNFNYFLENTGQELKKKKEQIEEEKSILLKEIQKKESMIDRCCEMLEEGVYTKEKYLKRVNTLESDLNTLQANLEALNDISYDDEEQALRTIPILEKVLDEYWNLTGKQRNEILKSFIEKIEYTKTTSTRGQINNDKPIELKIYLRI